jgi:hypothetical protein
MATARIEIFFLIYKNTARPIGTAKQIISVKIMAANVPVVTIVSPFKYFKK